MVMRSLPVAFLAVSLTALVVAPKPAVSHTVVAGYYMSEMPVSQIPAEQLTDIIYAFGEPNRRNVCQPPDAHQNVQFARLRTLRSTHPRLRLLLSIGGVFVLEALSVIIQVGSFKMTGKRVFRMAPLHHHFELMGWSESKIIVRFWIVALVFALFSLTTLKLR